MMKRLALVAIALFFCATLSGWNHLGWKWSQDDIPITYRVGDSSPTGMSHGRSRRAHRRGVRPLGRDPLLPHRRGR